MKNKQHFSTSNIQRSQSISRNTSKKSTSQLQSKAAQLFQIIQTFHNTLCGLPLDTLISTDNPERWIQQQCHTLQQLLSKIQHYNNHSQYQYYNAKLDSVRRILSNITENIQMLMKMKINNYNSASSIATSRVSIQSTERQSSNQEQNSNLADIANGLLFIDNYQLSNKDKQSKNKRQNHLPISMQSQTIMKKNEKKEELNDLKLTFDKNYLLSTLTKAQLEIPQQMTKTITTDYSRKQITEKAEDIPFEIITSRTQNQGAQCQQQIQKRIILMEELELVTQQNKALVLKLKEKQQAIQRLLQSYQSIEQSNDKLKENLRNEHLQSQFYAQRIQILENCSKKHEKELQQWMEREKDLRDTIRFNQQTITKLEEEKIKLIEQAKKQHNQEQQKQREIDQLHTEIINLRKSLRIQKQKGQIYKQKFYKSIGNYNQENNINIRNQLKQTLEKHKDKLRDWEL